MFLLMTMMMHCGAQQRSDGRALLYDNGAQLHDNGGLYCMTGWLYRFE
jgi:hypothetical protein